MGGTDESRAELDGLLASLRSGAAGSTPQALPARAYSSPALFALEVDRIFRREWLLVARADEIPDTGDRVTVDVVGEPVVIVRGEDQRLRALSGVCRHRYFPLSEPGFSTGRRLTCSYHRWSYGLDGRCVAAPLMDDTPGFDRSQIALPSLPLEEWEGFVFVSLDPEIEPLSPRLDPISAELARHRLAEQQQTTRYSAVWSGNWKAAVENGSESYHHMGLHSRTVQPYMPAQGSTFVTATDHFAWHRTPIARFAERHGTRAGLDTGLTDADRGHARFFTIFPATVISVVGDSVDWITFLPLSPDRVHAFGGFVFPTWAIDPEELERLRTTQAKTSEQINEEDRASVERLQQVVGSRLAAPGPLNVREGALGAFARYLARRLAAGPRAG